ncbi:ribonuclease domain-containing protein [Actinokineospora bangkokensis]|uniref:Ribonuclease N n=1 Tax=Actinokineospora bangkokensis TaxID=1193682 RepID=A0A1Q9LTQ0_9PSEU|nr:ribonuclease domain-containing protein [Actinokineospora bangkokensis]OLR95379.1 ribonuclease N [Actinokineospora bangkokensis]
MGSRKRITGALVGLVLLVLLGWLTKVSTDDDAPAGAAAPTSTARSSGSPSSPSPSSRAAGVTAPAGMAVEPLSSLPRQARDTWALIEGGGPFPYPRNDGVTFQNREGRLPKESSGYYKEYTVPTPGSPDRGARRLITGAEREVYYTEDHYGSFVAVDVAR